MTTAEFMCLALTVYFEARSEPIVGQIAVAEIVLNRVHDASYPDQICEVVQQGGTRRDRCQFSYYCDGKPETPENRRAWRRAKVVAKLTYEGVLSASVDGATHYHTDYSNPYWSSKYFHVATVGRHLFYQRSRSPDAKFAGRLAVGSSGR